MIEMLHEALAVGLGRVVLGILDRRVAEQAAAGGTASQVIGVVDGVPGFMTQDPQARPWIAAFDLQHLGELELRQTRMRQVEGNRDAGDAVRGEPLVGQPVVRAERQAARVELGVELRDPLLDLGAFDRQPEVAHADPQQLLVAERRPVGRLQRLRIGGSCFDHPVSRS